MMKTKSKLFLILFVIVTLISTAVFATEVTNTNTETEPVTTSEEGVEVTSEDTTTGDNTQTDENVEASDKYFSGDDVEINTLIDGNVFVIAKNVKLTGQIGGDLFVIAETLTIDGGAIYGSVFVTASEITINGQMYDVYATCDKMRIEYDGYVYRDLRVMGTEVSINGVVRRNSFIETNKLILDKDCLMPGNLNYTAQSEAVYMKTVQGDGEEKSTEETTEIPAENVSGEIKFTKRNKKVFSKENAVKSSVEKIIKNNKINNDTSEENLKSIILGNVLNNLGVKSNSELTKKVQKTMQIPALYVYIDVIVIVLLILALVLPRIMNSKKTSTDKKEKVENAK